MCGRLKWRTNAWRFSAARSSEIPRINLATCTDPRGWIGLPATGEGGGGGCWNFSRRATASFNIFLEISISYLAIRLQFS